jgi:uncharacterized membrane protein
VRPNPRKFALIAAALLYVSAGILHFLFPQGYAKIIPPFFPAPLALVYVSGVAEIAGGLGLLIPRLRRAAAWGLVALLIAVFPANIYMVIASPHVWYLWARLPLQFLLIWWLLWCAGALNRGNERRLPV